MKRGGNGRIDGSVAAEHIAERAGKKRGADGFGETQARIAQVCIGRFHHFDIARELERRGSLVSVTTGYPRAKLRNAGLPDDRIRTLPWLFAVYMGLSRFGLAENPAGRELLWRSHELLDSWVRGHLPEADFLLVLSGSGLRCGRAFQEAGGRFICDRGSTHMAFQKQVMEEEYSRWGLEFRQMDARLMEKEIREYDQADLITVPTRFCRRTFVAQGIPEAKVAVIPYGLPAGDFFPAGSPPREVFRVLFVGQITLRKGVPYLLQAFGMLRHPRKELVMAGIERADAKRWLAKMPLDNVRFLGHQTRSALRDWMSCSHVLVLPSVEEGMALVQAQALACGCPLIISEATGGEELIADGREGFIVPTRSVEQIAEKLERLAGDANLQARMRCAALATARRVGGWGRYADDLFTHLRRLKPSK